MQTDLEIARQATLEPIAEIAAKLGIPGDEIIPYGRDKAKLPLGLLPKEIPAASRLILVTATTPTPAGEGKTTVSIGLGDGLSRIGKKTCVALREPSLGPVFGIKGGAAGGGYAQVVPMEDINLHFTGDLHAITAANNLICALMDNYIYQGDAAGLDTKQITFKRCMDVNDRQLRSIVDGLGRAVDGVTRQDGFNITAASEVMAILCLATGMGDLKERLRAITLGYSYDGTAVTVGDIGAENAAAILLKDAIMPNLVQTLEHTPVLIHGGPFANIAHGCSSVIATRMSMGHAEYTVTEAGFGADLGAEKFLDIKCRDAGIWPNAVVLVTTVRSLKHHGGAAKDQLTTVDTAALERGFANLDRHLSNLRGIWGVPVVVAINRFPSDSAEELRLLEAHVRELGAPCELTECFARGGEGTEGLARAVTENIATGQPAVQVYKDDLSVMEKISVLARRVYGAADVSIEPAAAKKIQRFEKDGLSQLPICIAKTQYSFSDDASRLGAPEGYTFTVRDAELCSGAGFIVILCGDIMRMPGLSRKPAAVSMYIDDNGRIDGLF
ncbi:MAG: formate--tetrahydrofolate ligase [Clostridia bacterium]|nr:formate--tetrahydrofolate ligase [Clostridia bacterium]